MTTGEVFVKAVFYVDKFWDTKYLWAIFECFFVALGQEAMDIYLKYIKSDHTRTW